MSCCGKARSQFRNPALEAFAVPATQNLAQFRAIQPEWIAFEYTGDTALTARGPITRRIYRFDKPGAVVQVDQRDAPAMLAVPRLRRANV